MSETENVAPKSITEEIAQLRALPLAELAARYEAITGRPPRIRNKEWMWKRAAWALQSQRYGGLGAVAKNRLESLIAEIDLPLCERQRTIAGKLKRPSKTQALAVGTTLQRQWRGRQVVVHVVEGGVEYENARYPSLSAAVRAITGQHWNAKLFFGMSKRRKAK